jgi:hypothetical protein
MRDLFGNEIREIYCRHAGGGPAIPFPSISAAESWARTMLARNGKPIEIVDDDAVVLTVRRDAFGHVWTDTATEAPRDLLACLV